MRPAPPTAALVEQHEAVRLWIEEPAVPWHTSRTWAAVQDDGWLTLRIPTRLPVDEVALIHFQHPMLVRLDLGIEICRDQFPPSLRPSEVVSFVTSLFAGAGSSGNPGQGNAVQRVDLYVDLAKPRNTVGSSPTGGRALEVADRR